jgi:hypothetical protein
MASIYLNRSEPPRGITITDPFPPKARTAEQLSSLAGTYYNDEIETTLTVVQENGGLVIHRRPADTIKLTPIGTEAFVGPGGMIFNFFANQLSIHESRVWDLRFQRR